MVNFKITEKGSISGRFLRKGIRSFGEAALFVKDLPYGRNGNKADLTTVFDDNCGTCSSKHALLKQLADENNFPGLRLMLGLYKMNGQNTPPVADTLRKNGLPYLPEAHNYLKYQNKVIDLTFSNSGNLFFIDDLLEETEIRPEQITDYKVNYHKSYIMSWLYKNTHLKFTLEEIWNIREQCICDLKNESIPLARFSTIL